MTLYNNLTSKQAPCLHRFVGVCCKWFYNIHNVTSALPCLMSNMKQIMRIMTCSIQTRTLKYLPRIHCSTVLKDSVKCHKQTLATFNGFLFYTFSCIKHGCTRNTLALVLAIETTIELSKWKIQVSNHNRN